MALPLHQSTLKLYQILQHQNTKGRASMNQAWHDVQLLCLNCSFFFLGCPTLQQFLLFVFSRKNKELTKNQVQQNGVTKQGPNTATPFLVCSSCDEVELPCPGEEGGIDLAMTVFK